MIFDGGDVSCNPQNICFGLIFLIRCGRSEATRPFSARQRAGQERRKMEAIS
jgi:hypothetical protein